MKVPLTIADDCIALPLDLLGLPTQNSSWVGKSRIFIGEAEFKIVIHRKSFFFEKPSLFEVSESLAKKGFINRNDLEVRRFSKGKARHHIPLKGVLSNSKAQFLRGSFDFLVESVKISEEITQFTLIFNISQIPSDFETIKEVRSLLVG